MSDTHRGTIIMILEGAIKIKFQKQKLQNRRQSLLAMLNKSFRYLIKRREMNLRSLS